MAVFSSLFQVFTLKYLLNLCRLASMNNEFPLDKMDLALFESQHEHIEFSRLKDFISFLRLYKCPMPYSFSHVEVGGPLIENLSLDENLLLHTSVNKGETTEGIIQKILEQTGNPHLLNFYNSISLKHLRPSQVDDKTRKSVALIKAMLQNQEFLFLENPEKYLCKQMLTLFTQALSYQSVTTGQIIVISTRFKNIWASQITKRIYRDENNYFQVSHYNKSVSDSILSMNNAPKREEEGLLKIVNPSDEFTETNKKAA